MDSSLFDLNTSTVANRNISVKTKKKQKNKKKQKKNSVDPDETAHYEPSNLDLRYLHRYRFSLRTERVNCILKVHVFDTFQNLLAHKSSKSKALTNRNEMDVSYNNQIDIPHILAQIRTLNMLYMCRG